jgi:hypothetical protein
MTAHAYSLEGDSYTYVPTSKENPACDGIHLSGRSFPESDVPQGLQESLFIVVFLSKPKVKEYAGTQDETGPSRGVV